jgi:predicted metal-binding membrane protein
MGMDASLARVLQRDRVIALSALGAIAMLAWVYTIWMAWAMESGDASRAALLPNPRGWSAGELAFTFAMWVIMMVGMMLPSATPMILLFTRALRSGALPHTTVPLTTLFALGYIAAWSGFSLLATLAQWALHSASLLSPMMVSSSGRLGALLLVVAGVFQWTPLKHACLGRCRSPLAFMMTEWRAGSRGAFIMGLRHGLFCVGCCWALMLLLFVTGVMNLVWIALLAVFVLLEKTLRGGEWLARGVGVLLIAAGLWMLALG